MLEYDTLEKYSHAVVCLIQGAGCSTARCRGVVRPFQGGSLWILTAMEGPEMSIAESPYRCQ